MKRITLEDLTLREKIGQMALTQMGIFANISDLDGFLKKIPLGNVWHNCNDAMNTANLASIEIDCPQDSTYYRNLLKKIAKASKVPPFFAMDCAGRRQATDLVDIANPPLNQRNPRVQELQH